MIKHKVLGEIKVPKKLREDKRRKVYLFVGENEEGTKPLPLLCMIRVTAWKDSIR